MARLFFISLGLLVSALSLADATESSAVVAGGHLEAANFVRSSCQTTTYPAKCVQSLIRWSPVIKKSTRRLANMALSVSLTKAKTTNTFVHQLAKLKGLKRGEIGAIADCCQVIDDTVEKLNNSIVEMKGLTLGSDFSWHISNLETWISAALTDENTCTDGFSGEVLNAQIKGSIKKRMVDVGQVTSNALALITKYAAEH